MSPTWEPHDSMMMELSVVWRRWKRGKRAAMDMEETKVQVVRYLDMEEVKEDVLKGILGNVLKEIFGTQLVCFLREPNLLGSPR